MTVGAIVQAAGANFVLLGPKDTSCKSTKPVISVGAVRTGCGKSQTSRRIIEILMAEGLKVVAVRHPMPYGDLVAQKVQRFAGSPIWRSTSAPSKRWRSTNRTWCAATSSMPASTTRPSCGQPRTTRKGCDVILWDGGNNDFPFYKPDLQVTVVDPHRAGPRDELLPGRGHPAHGRCGGDQQDRQRRRPAGIETVRKNIAAVNPTAVVVDAASALRRGRPVRDQGQAGAGGGGRARP